MTLMAHSRAGETAPRAALVAELDGI